MRDKGAVAFIGGPEDTCVSEALVAAAWNLPMISFVSSLFSLLFSYLILRLLLALCVCLCAMVSTFILFASWQFHPRFFHK